MATQNNSNVTVSFLPTKSTKADGIWLAISKPYSLTDAAKLAIATNFKYQAQRWGADRTEEPSLSFSHASMQKGATQNLYYLGPKAVFGRSDVQQAIMGILSQDGALKVSAQQPAKVAPQSAGAVYQLLGAAPAPQVVPQVQAQQVAAAYQPNVLTFNLPQAPAPQQAAPQVVPATPAKFIRIG